MQQEKKKMQQSYDLVAQAYATEYYNELDEKPFDRNLLEQFVLEVKDMGIVCEIGCGPSEIGRFLLDRGICTYGLDISFGMLEVARRLNSNMNFVQADMIDLPARASSHGGVIAFYSINHIERSALPTVIRGIHRILVPDGLLLLAIHLGEGELHTADWFNMPVSVETTFFSLNEVTNAIEDRGFRIEQSIEREPYPIEWKNQRGYIYARKQQHKVT